MAETPYIAGWKSVLLSIPTLLTTIPPLGHTQSKLFLRLRTVKSKTESFEIIPAQKRLRSCGLPPPKEAGSRRNSRIVALGSKQGRMGEIGHIPFLYRGESLENVCAHPAVSTCHATRAVAAREDSGSRA